MSDGRSTLPLRRGRRARTTPSWPCCSPPAEPRLGGVLLRGDKGSAKTTLARGLAALLPGDAPFVELPLGATEDRVIGSLDLAAAAAPAATRRFRPGLLAAAARRRALRRRDQPARRPPGRRAARRRRVAASTGSSATASRTSHPARFVLVGSMNPEEGELRPQLLDRFGLAVDITASDRRRRRAPGPSAASSPPSPARRSTPRSRPPTTGVRASPRRTPPVRPSRSPTSSRAGQPPRPRGRCRGAARRPDAVPRRRRPRRPRRSRRAGLDDLRVVAEHGARPPSPAPPFDEPGISPQELDDAWDRATDDTAQEDRDGGSDRADDEQHDAARGRDGPPAPDVERRAAPRSSTGNLRPGAGIARPLAPRRRLRSRWRSGGRCPCHRHRGGHATGGPSGRRTRTCGVRPAQRPARATRRISGHPRRRRLGLDGHRAPHGGHQGRRPRTARRRLPATGPRRAHHVPRRRRRRRAAPDGVGRDRAGPARTTSAPVGRPRSPPASSPPAR